MSVTNTPVEQKQQQRHNYCLGIKAHHHHHIGGSNASISQGGSFGSGIDHDSGGGIIATSSPRGREQSEEAEERGRSRSREDQVDSTDDSFDDISLMGFKTGTKHHSPIKMKKVR
ncbi:unnamed protein product [Candida parapsilosis]